MQLELFPLSMLPPKNKVGRPLFKISDENQHVVRSLRRAGLTQRAIAEAIGCTHPTLMRHFRAIVAGRIEKPKQTASDRS
jgi:DNA invertase Pin-like site-specific DNA recombinase